jgi:integrase
MVPKELQTVFGKSRFSQALGTGDKRRAEALAAPLVAKWKAEISQARGNNGALSQTIIEWQSAFKQQDEFISQGSGDPRDNMSQKSGRIEGKEVLKDHYYEHLETKTIEERKIINSVVLGENSLTRDHYNTWKNQLTLAPKTIDQMSRDVDALVSRFTTLNEINNDAVLDLVAEFERQGKGVSTIKRVLGAYKNYWHYLQNMRVVTSDINPFEHPFLHSKIRRARKDTPRRQSFTALETVKLWETAKSKNDEQLADLIMLAAYTGARIKELCSIQLEDVTTDFIRIRNTKTEAGNREIPLHSALLPLISKLQNQSTDNYLITQLSSNKYDDRSNAIGKRFGRLKTEVGHDRTLVFHSFRKTLITLLEQAGVPENFSCDIVGHEKGTIGYGHYSGGASLANKKEAIEKVRYPFPHI